MGEPVGCRPPTNAIGRPDNQDTTVGFGLRVSCANPAIRKTMFDYRGAAAKAIGMST